MYRTQSTHAIPSQRKLRDLIIKHFAKRGKSGSCLPPPVSVSFQDPSRLQLNLRFEPGFLKITRSPRSIDLPKVLIFLYIVQPSPVLMTKCLLKKLNICSHVVNILTTLEKEWCLKRKNNYIPGVFVPSLIAFPATVVAVSNLAS